MFNQPGWNQSAEDAWLTPPDVWDDEDDDSYECVSVAELLEEMRRIAETLYNKRFNEGKTPGVAGAETKRYRRQ
jgi:hypothetical protein